MICSHCGKEIEQGQVYCPYCGKIQQLVPDYFEAEEEILNETSQIPQSEPVIRRTDDSGEQRAEEAHRKKRRRILLICVLAAAVLAVIAGVMVYRSRQRSSYEVQMKLAQEAYADGKYEKAVRYAERALTLNGSSTDARILLYRASLETGVTDLSLLTEVLKLDPENKNAYTLLITYYTDSDDYDALYALAENAPDDEILALFDGYLTASPVISPDGGTYEHNTEITITADAAVYYTTDGSIPTENDTLYEEPFILESGSWTVTAIAVDETGRASLISSAEFIIDPQVPSAVQISPSGGTYTEQITITLRADDGCTIYYGWDTTDAEELQSVYEGAIEIIEGNHILSAVAVSEDGLYGTVSSRSFIYLPDEASDTEE